jgi:hypothetical protein
MKSRKKTFKTFKKNKKAQENIQMDIQAISGGSRRRHTCKCKTCGKSMKKSRRR